MSGLRDMNTRTAMRQALEAMASRRGAENQFLRLFRHEDKDIDEPIDF